MNFPRNGNGRFTNGNPGGPGRPKNPKKTKRPEKASNQISDRDLIKLAKPFAPGDLYLAAMAIADVDAELASIKANFPSCVADHIEKAILVQQLAQQLLHARIQGTDPHISSSDPGSDDEEPGD